MRIGVISHTQKLNSKPERYVSKNAAAALVRRLLAVHVTKHLIQMVDIRQVSGLPAVRQTATHKPCEYQHHLEPRLEELTLADSPWLQYMAGMPYEAEA